MSQNTSSTPGGKVNRGTSSRQGQVDSDSNADFGQKIGRSENIGNEPSRRSGNEESGIGSSSSSSGSSRSSSDKDLSRNASSGRGSSGSSEH